jgi:hypothetical protein
MLITEWLVDFLTTPCFGQFAVDKCFHKSSVAPGIKIILHRTKLVHLKAPAPLAYPLLHKQNRTWGIEDDGYRTECHDSQDKGKDQKCDGQIYQSLGNPIAPASQLDTRTMNDYQFHTDGSLF